MSDKKTETKAAEHHGIAPAFELKDHKKDVEFILQHAKLNAKGDTLTVNQTDMDTFFEKHHGVTKSDMKRVKDAIERADVALSVAAASLAESNIKKAVAAGEDPSRLSATAKGHTEHFTHSASVTASVSQPAGLIKPGEVPQRKTCYGKIRVGLDIRGELNTDLVTKTAELIQKSMGL